ncbi:hypothetical protein ILUMI_19946 [Ignelater luminosus]|uniref:DDE-1 domain-containing protein n=1 Tax=Ignelater luminosus TaxID=2038154 RepID=A0A8K0G2Q8_IGNLU|nr:hypothetical protein ILUMI_19946 [Ignelater luminosus]
MEVFNIWLTEQDRIFRSYSVNFNSRATESSNTKSTFSHQLRKKHNTKPGRPNVLDANEKKALEHILMKTAEWGLPVAGDDLHNIVKAYLDKQGRIIEQFHHNIPGKHWTKYPERILNSTKTAILLFAATADGKSLPPYVVYKAEQIYDGWCIGGPKHTRYNRTKLGWVDAEYLEDWFLNIV